MTRLGVLQVRVRSSPSGGRAAHFLMGWKVCGPRGLQRLRLWPVAAMRGSSQVRILLAGTWDTQGPAAASLHRNPSQGSPSTSRVPVGLRTWKSF